MLKAYFFKKLIPKRAIPTTQTQTLIIYTCAGNFQEHWLATFDAMFWFKNSAGRKEKHICYFLINAFMYILKHKCQALLV